MNEINWKQKLTSRKLWCALAAAVVMILTALFGETLTPEMVEVIRYGIYVLIAYIFGESAVDIARQLVEKIKKAVLPEKEYVFAPEESGTGEDTEI